MVEIRWLGAAGLEIAYNGNALLIDPYLSRVGKVDLFFRRLRPSAERIRSYTRNLGMQVSAVICGHTHFDHVLDVPFIAREMGCTLVGSSSLKTLTQICGINPDIRVCTGGERIELPGGAVAHMISSRHGLVLFGKVPYPGEIDPHDEPPLKASQYRLGGMFMPRVEVGGVCIVHMGSANYIETELEGHGCNVLFMCVPGWKNIPGYPSECLAILRPEVVIPFHFDDFTSPIPKSRHVRAMPTADLKGFVEEIKRHAPGTVVLVPDPHEVMRF